MAVSKPPKPYPDFPLFAHSSKQWAKKIRGRTYYFGHWQDWEGALQKYVKERDYLHAGQLPPSDYTTLADVLNAYLEQKKRALEIGDIGDRAYKEYETVCDVVATLGKHRPFESLNADDLSRLRNTLAKGKKGQVLSPVSHKRLLTQARMVFLFANEELGYNIRYKKPLRTPPKAKIRERRNAIGERMFEAAEIRTLIEAAEQPLKAMILLGINCALGPRDIVCLPTSAVDLKNGFHNFARPKTQVPRRCPLWSDTVVALGEVIHSTGPVFNGRVWNRHIIAHQFKDLAETCGIYQEHTKTFYSLRRTFETIAKTAEVNQSVIDRIMGHERPDMSEVYNQKTFDSQLVRCTEHVRQWVQGSITLD